MTDASKLKPMELFAIDNAGAWGKGAALVGDLVVWPDKGMYPAAVPVGLLTHPAFDGTIVVQAGNLCLLISFLPGIPSANKAGIRAVMSDKVNRPEQYRLALDALVHRMLLAGAGGDADLSAGARAHEHSAGLDPLALIAWMAKHNPKEAAVVEQALSTVAREPQPLTFTDVEGSDRALMKDDVYQVADDMLVAIGEARRKG